MVEPFEHQQEAVDYLKGKASIGFWDDMGVGKTVEAIMIDQIRRKQEWPNPKTLVVTIAGPTVDSWVRHFALWSPELRVVALDPKRREACWNEFINTDADVFIMHWDAVRLMPQLQRTVWLHIIGDEIHRICGRSTAMTKSFKKIKGGFKTGLSGTPTTGAPHMLWSILNWMYPKVYTSYWRFFEEHIIWEMDKSGRYRKIIAINAEACERLQEEMSKFTVRRLLRDVRPNMPDRLPPEQIFVDLLPIQRKAYNQMRDDMIAWVDSKRMESGTDEITDPIVAQAAVSRLTRLLQFSCAYARLEEVTVTRHSVQIVERHVRLSEPSSKLDAVMDTKIRPALEEGVKIVVFSDFRQLIELLNVRLEKENIPYATIHGNIPQRDRNAEVQRFQVGNAMVCTITKAGGTGIDLFAGERIVLLSRDWSPGVNDQAIGRIDRIGQTKAIQVTDITARHTIEGEKNRTVELKWSWMKKVLGS